MNKSPKLLKNRGTEKTGINSQGKASIVHSNPGRGIARGTLMAINAAGLPGSCFRNFAKLKQSSR